MCVCVCVWCVRACMCMCMCVCREREGWRREVLVLQLARIPNACEELGEVTYVAHIQCGTRGIRDSPVVEHWTCEGKFCLQTPGIDSQHPSANHCHNWL